MFLALFFRKKDKKYQRGNFHTPILVLSLQPLIREANFKNKFLGPTGIDRKCLR